MNSHDCTHKPLIVDSSVRERQGFRTVLLNFLSVHNVVSYTTQRSSRWLLGGNYKIGELVAGVVTNRHQRSLSNLAASVATGQRKRITFKIVQITRLLMHRVCLGEFWGIPARVGVK